MRTPNPSKNPTRTGGVVKGIIGVVVAGILAVTVGPYVYIHFVKADAPAALSLDDVSVGTTDPTVDSTSPAVETDSTATGSATSDGAVTYTLTAESEAGYRVVEVLFGQDTEGVGRTNNITGSITVDGTAVTAADFTVDMTTLISDEDNRDRKFSGEIMDTGEYPTATFEITEPIMLGTVPADGSEITASATGDLTLHGVTKSVTIEVTAKRTGDSIAIAGSTDIVFADYGIDNPSNNAVTTQDHGLIEFLLVATSADAG